MPCTTKTAVITIAISLIVGLPVHTGLSATQNPKSSPIPAELLTGTGKRRNPAFAISAESVLQKVAENQDIIVIDVRKKAEFEKSRIPGSINIPLFAVKTKAFLKFNSLVIVNKVYNYGELEQECEQLIGVSFSHWSCGRFFVNTENDLQGILSPKMLIFDDQGRALVVAAFPFSIADLLVFSTFIFVRFC